MPLTEGQIVGSKYRLQRPLGAGGMGSVWLASHLELGSSLAVKFQHPSARALPEDAERFRREARAAASLAHPHIVRVFDYGVDGDTAFIAMELLEGESLQTRLDRHAGGLPLSEACDLVQQAASGLDHAHGRGIVHRDIKPSNLFIAREGMDEVLKILDFGVAKWLDASRNEDGIQTDSAVLVGSSAYMSPEQARGGSIDARSDVWSLAAVTYQLATGVQPFFGRNVPDTLARVCAGEFEPISRLLGGGAAELDEVLSRALAVDRSRRFNSAGDFAGALARSTKLARLAAAAPAPRVVPQFAFGREGDTASFRATESRTTEPRPRKTGAATRYFVMALGVSAGAVTLVTVRGAQRDEGAERSRTERNGEAPPRAPAEAPGPSSLANVRTVPSTASAVALRSALAPPPAAPSNAPNRASAAPRVRPKVAPAPRSELDPIFGLAVPPKPTEQ